ncbi:hypothetical protein AOC36_02035 [Erysipelothrix larvae]|uniref:DUF4860 domain-containing protein n=1 Tax=Erysipelothrix larvae TaxID=1514105 RepID=A0A120JTG6_9FIRM|nr:hypothetical protein [Erysipelothrix larvae]AMC92805.1 hypothetical protein AOC36_02035 [Erysipelothrix larvae]
MRKYFITFLVFGCGMALFFMLYQYNMKSIKRDGVMETLERTSEVAYINALDGSYRITKGSMNITSQETYETIFKEIFLNDSTVNLDQEHVIFAFEYLVELEDGTTLNTALPQQFIHQGGVVKGIRNTVWVDGQDYSVRYILDISKGRE